MATFLAMRAPVPAVPAVDLPGLIDSIGQLDFGSRLVSFLHSVCGAECVAVCQLSGDQFGLLLISCINDAGKPGIEGGLHARYDRAGLWRQEPSVRDAQAEAKSGRSVLIRADISRLTHPLLREIISGANIGDRLHLYGPTQHATIGLGLTRFGEMGRFSPAEMQEVSALSRSLIAVVAKHAAIQWSEPKLPAALASLGEIQACVAAAPESLPRREAEVCARTIYGMSLPGIALDLGISEGTVLTYRKRSNARLGLASQKELLRWYLAAWGRRARAGRLAEEAQVPAHLSSNEQAGRVSQPQR